MLRYYGLMPAIRRQIRNELLTGIPRDQRSDWQVARLVVGRARRLQGSLDPCPEMAALRETDSTRAVSWYQEVILPSRAIPHLLVRTTDDRALAVWSCFSNRLLASVNPPYSVEACGFPGLVLIVQGLDAYLSPPVDRQALLVNLFDGSPGKVPIAADHDEDEDPDYG